MNMPTCLKITYIQPDLFHEEFEVAYKNKLGISGRESKMEVEAQNAYIKVWMVVEVDYTWIVKLVEVSVKGTNYNRQIEFLTS